MSEPRALLAEHKLFPMATVSELARVHPQTIRGYERRGLVRATRTSGNIRLYSADDIARVRRIHALTTRRGLNLAAVARVLEIEESVRVLLLWLVRVAGEVRGVDEASFDELRELGGHVWRSLGEPDPAEDIEALSRRALELSRSHPHARRAREAANALPKGRHTSSH